MSQKLMRAAQLTPGDLVRYTATNSRWHFGVVRGVDGDLVEVEFFWGSREDVPLEHVTPFRDYLDSRERKLSLKRTALCEAFFGDPLYRLRRERVQKIQATLRQHGLDFHPKHWPTPDTRVQIWLDHSVVFNSKLDKDTKFETLLPRWLEPLKLPPSSRDPLGLQAHAERLANELLPGVTVFTSRIGYYGFLTWAIRSINELSCPSGQTRIERLQRLERALVLCEFVHHGADNNSCPLLGQRSKTQVLQSAEGDRFRVPKRILKNQASAGAYRLYFTSLQSLGLVEEASDLGAEDLLPLTLTDLGKRLAHAFELRLPSKFSDFGLSDGLLDRDTIRSWGTRLCFSELGGLGRYREPFLEGSLLGNSPDAEKRYRTVQRLFQRGLLTGSYEEQAEEPAVDMVSEEDARAVEEVTAVAGLGNDTVLLHFYEESPLDDNRDFQAAAVFELLSLGLSALFQVVVEELWKVGRTRPVDLVVRIAGDQQLSQMWGVPLKTSAIRAPKARTLVQRFLKADDPFRRAAIGGVLLARVLGDRPFAAVPDDLGANPALVLVDTILRSRPERSLTEAFPDLIAAMVDRHQSVSTNKNRQRWCYFDGDTVVKDDLQKMQVGFHAFRFPQLFSLCWDLGLRLEDLQHGI
jgi:hypothetical protein